MSRSQRWAGAVLILLTAVVYIPVFRGGFIFDDYQLIVDNQLVHARDGLYRFWFTGDSPDYRPVTWSLWWLEWRLWDGRATGYHVVNVLLHAVNCVLIWKILQRLKISGAWLAAAIFAIHPVNVVTAAWISEQKNTLSMLFYAFSILLYLRFDEEGKWRWYVFSLGACFLALLSKSAVVMVPVVLLGCVWWRHGRVRARDWLYSAPYFAASLALAIVTIIQHHRALPEDFVQPSGFAARLAGAGWVPWFYLSKALVPVDLMMIYPKWQIDPSRWISYVPGVALVGCLAVFWWKRKTLGRPLLFGLGYFLVMLFPVLGFFDQTFYRFSLVADHWQYYSIIGVIALAVAAGIGLAGRMVEHGRLVGLASLRGRRLVVGLVLVVLGVLTWGRCSIYADGRTLWQDNATRNPGSWVVQNNLGAVLQAAGRAAAAKEHYEQVLRIRPDSYEAHNNLGSVLLGLGQVPEAMEQFNQALQVKPTDAAAHSNLGNALLELGKVPEAIEQFKEALRVQPDFGGAHYNLGVALVRQGHDREAMEQFEQALKFSPDDAASHNNLGLLLYERGEVPEAIAHYEQALRFKPDYVEAHQNLGIALSQVGRIQEAMTHYEVALRLNPDYAEAHYCLGDVLLRAGRVQEAVDHYQQALRVKPDYVDVHNNLGAALVNLGRIPEAIEQFEAILRLKPDLAEAHYNLGVALERAGRIQEAIDHYEQVVRLKPDYVRARNKLDQLRSTQSAPSQP